jgi:hypothetical protein
MSKRLTHFLIQLSTDPRQLEQFEADPVGTMEAAGLSVEERRAVLSRSPDAIRRQLGQLHVSTMTDEDGDQKPGDKKKKKKKQPSSKPKKKAAKKKK